MSQHGKGSSYHLLNWTKMPREELAENLEKIIDIPFVKISPDCYWVPDRAKGNNKELILPEFCNRYCRDYEEFDVNEFTNWWLKGGTNPTWDFLSTCTIKGKKGIVLVEAKSHSNELKREGKSIKIDEEIYPLEELENLLYEKIKSSKDGKLMIKRVLKKLNNHDKIGQCIAEARGALSGWIPKINISRDDHYQLSNRIACTWKLAQCGVPSVLLYLGFTKDNHWSEIDQIRSKDEWDRIVWSYFSEVGANRLLDHKTITLRNGCTANFCAGVIEL